MYKKEKVSGIRLFLFLLMEERYEENKTKKICISIFIVVAIVNVINIYGNNIYANTVSEVENNIDEESGNCPIYYSKNKSSDEKQEKC